MADKTRLEMKFKNAEDRTARISLNSPKPGLTGIEVDAVMNDIITKNIFSSSGGDLVSISGARIVTTQVQELEL